VAQSLCRPRSGRRDGEEVIAMTSGGEIGAVLRECLQAAIAAPSVHNTQPWLFQVRPGGVDVYADRRRALPVIDPRGRELLISVGAATLNLRVAILAHGRVPVQQLWPDRRRPDLVARVTIGPHTTAPETARRLAQAIPHRHTNRRPFSGVLVPGEVLTELADAAAVEGATLVLADPEVRHGVLSLVRTAESRWRNDPAYWNELATWTAEQAERRDGVPPAAFGPWSAMEIVPLRDFGLIQPVRGRYAADFEDSPTIAMLYTAGDSPDQWVRAGQALERVLQTATVRGVASTPMTQPLEIPELRDLLTDRSGGHVAHAILRLGYGQPGTPSPRRSVDECLIGPVVTARRPSVGA
jgi:nitroreductase